MLININYIQIFLTKYFDEYFNSLSLTIVYH